MLNNISLNEDQEDCLQELVNIAYGSATAAISNILDAFATLSIPKITILDTKDLKSYLLENVKINDSHYVSSQIINGKISGENLFVIDKTSAYNMAKEFELDDDEIDDNQLCDIILEITNILSSSTISKLAYEMETIVSFSPPQVYVLDSISDFDNKYLEKYHKVIVISTQLNFENQNINGELLIMTTDDSIIYIKQMLNKMLEAL